MNQLVAFIDVNLASLDVNLQWQFQRARTPPPGGGVRRPGPAKKPNSLMDEWMHGFDLLIINGPITN